MTVMAKPQDRSSRDRPASAKLRLVFMGTPDFAVPALRVLAADYDIVAVYCQPPRPKGRGMRLTPQAVHQAADELELLVRVPERFDQAAADELARLAPDLLVVVAYGLILPEALLALPRLGAINGHASILPRWRGAAPIHRAIEAGDKQTGVSVMMMDKGLDTGAVILERHIDIADTDTAGTLHDKLAYLTATALAEAIPMLADGSAALTPQDHDQAIYAHKITDAEAELNFTHKTTDILNKVRAFSPWPAAWMMIKQGDKSQRLNVLAATTASAKPTPTTIAGKSGAILGKGETGGMVIATADGAIELTQVKPAGKASMSGRDYLNGYPMPDHIITAADRD